jgi:hypothetical protein
MANDNIMNIDALLKSFDDIKLSADISNINSSQAKSLNEILAAYNASREAQQATVSPRTRDWLRDNYGIVGETQSEIEEQLAVLKELGQGKSKGMTTMDGAKAGADLGAKLAALLPETHETLAAGPRGFGVVGRK